ncbi:ABC transporter permease [Acidobacteriota bacterium]
MKKRLKPPKTASWLLRIFLRKENLNSRIDDFEEVFQRTAREKGKFQAVLWYWMETLSSIPMFIGFSILWSFVMFGNYVKIVIRNLKLNKVYSFINLSGLAIGMACCVLILLYVSDELSYDNFHKKSDRIFRINTISTIGETSRQYATAPPALAMGLADSIPEIEAFTGLSKLNINPLRGRYNDKNVEIFDIFYVDSAFFTIFSFEFLEGSRESAMDNPESIVISKETAKRIFGNESPLGKTIVIGSDLLLQVSGVIEDVPRNSHLQFNAVIPLRLFRDPEGNPQDFSEFNYNCEWYEYLLLRDGTDVSRIEKQIVAVAEDKWGAIYREKKTTRQYPLQNIKDLHLRSTSEFEPSRPGDISTVNLFSVVALFVLFIASFNFINLFTAHSTSRGQEIGMRKVLGSRRIQIVRQFLTESVIMSIISLVLGILLVMMVLPYFNAFVGKEFSPAQLLSSNVLLGILGIIVVTGILAGSYPALVLSAFDPIKVLKGKFSSASKNPLLRKTLVCVQFSISIFMIIGILVIVMQLGYIKNMNLGFNKNQMVIVPFFGEDAPERRMPNQNALKNKLKQNPGIVSASLSIHIPGGDMRYSTFLPEGRNSDETFRAMHYWVDHNFIDTYGMEIILGRDFSKNLSTDADQALIINEKSAEILGSGEDVIGKRLLNVLHEPIGVIVGVIRNFHSEGMKNKISPVVLSVETPFFSYISVRIRPENMPKTLAYIESSLREIYPEREFEYNYSFIDDDFKNKYPEEEKIRGISIVFGCLAVFLACLGVLGLTSLSVEQRTKEIGVRKVLGASVYDIVKLLSKEFSSWILAANLLAWPLAFFMMKGWLKNFAYRISIKWDIFIFSGILTAVIALLIVSLYSLKAAKSDPVDELRYE